MSQVLKEKMNDIESLDKSFKFTEDVTELPVEEINAPDMDLCLEETNLSESIALLLFGIGMEKYIKLFEEEDIPFDIFVQLNDKDLEEIGITDANDREIILKNLKLFEMNKNKNTVRENHVEDFNIANNLFNELLLLQNYCTYINIQMRKTKETDYRINHKETACTYLKAFTKSALIQANIISCRLYNQNNSDHLIGKMLKMYNLTLPKPLEEKLSSKKKKTPLLLKVCDCVGVFLLGFLSLLFLKRNSS